MRYVAIAIAATTLVTPCRGMAEYKIPPTGQIESVTRGDDGDVQAGGKLRYRDNGDGTVSDLTTGLMWEKKCDNICDPLHQVETRIGWTAEGPDSVAGWLAQINTEGTNGLGGHADWRLPTIDELQGLVDYGRGRVARVSQKAIDPLIGPTSSSGAYYTSTAVAGKPQEQWMVEFATGSTETKQGPAYVRAVRGPLRPLVPLEDHGDGTITDPNSGLMWEQKCLSCTGVHDVNAQLGWNPTEANSIWTWIKQVNREDGTGYAGYSDWRIPNIKELASLVDQTRAGSDDAVPTDPTVGPTRSWYWSSTAMAREQPFVWTVRNTGAVSSVGRGNRLHVRAVRTAGRGARARKVRKHAGTHPAAEPVSSPFTCAQPPPHIDLAVSTPPVEALRASMASRAESLAYLVMMQVIEVSADGTLKLRGKDRMNREARKLIDQEHRDRNALYQEIAKANGLSGNRAAREVQHLMATSCVVIDAYPDQRRDTSGTMRLYVGVRLGRPLRPSQEIAVGLIGPRELPLLRSVASLSHRAVQMASGQLVRWEPEPTLEHVTGERGAKLAYLFLSDDRLLNAELIRAGLGYADPNPALRYHADLTTAQDEAQRREHGLWAPRKLASAYDPQGGGISTEINPICMEWRVAPSVRLDTGETVILLGIRAAGVDTSLTQDACAFLSHWLDGQSIRFEIDPVLDRKSTYVAAYALAPDGTSVSTALLRQGFVRLDPVDMGRGLRRSDELIAAEHEARAQRRGVWAANPVVGLETHPSCPLGSEPDGHQRCHLFRLASTDTVGLLGVRLPMPHAYKHDEAKVEAERMVAGQIIREEFDPSVTNRYGCDLAYVFLPDGTLLNAELVRRGYAQVEPNQNGTPLRYAKELLAAEQEAQAALRGIWGGTVVTSVQVSGHILFHLQRGGDVFLTGIQTPTLGNQNQKALATLLQPIVVGKPLQLAIDPRLAALGSGAGQYATLADGSSLNVSVVRQGFAYVPDLGRPFDLEERLRLAEHEARVEQRGLWAAHPVLGVSIRGYLAILVLRSGDARYDPPGMTAQLLGLNPWLGHAEQSGTFIGKLTTDKTVRLEFDASIPHDPVLTPVYARFEDGTLLNAEIIRQGYGTVDDHDGMQKLHYAKELAAAEAEAKAHRRGMWADEAQ